MKIVPVCSYYPTGISPVPPSQNVVFSEIPRYPHYVSPQLSTHIPQSTTNQYLAQSQLIEVKPHQENLHQVESRKNHAIAIRHPITKELITKEQLSKNAQPSLLRTDATNFIPSFAQTNAEKEVDASENEKNESSQQIPLELNETIENGFEEDLSFINDDNPSITASIRQIPLNLEQQLNQSEEDIDDSIVKTGCIPNVQPSHTSLPDSYRDESLRRPFQETYSQSTPFLNQNFQNESFQSRLMLSLNPPRNFAPRRVDRNHNSTTSAYDFRKPYPNQSRHNYQHHYNNNYNYNNNNDNNFRFHNKSPGHFHKQNHYQQNQQYQRHTKENFNHGSDKVFINNNNNTHNNNSYEAEWNRLPRFNSKSETGIYIPQSQKVDQECTAHPIKDIDLNNNTLPEAEKTMELKDLPIDLNNNEIKEDASTTATEESYTDSTVDNSESSLNLSWRYSSQLLSKLKKSPLVLTKPPTVKDDLLDSNLKNFVWKMLFEKDYRNDSNDSNESHNTSLPNKSSNNKRGNNNSRYDNHNNHLIRSKSVSEKQIIKMNLCIKEDVKLNKAENAWKPSHMKRPEDMNDEDRELEALRKNFRSLLNKLTAENFEHLIDEINDKRKFTINTFEKLSAVR